VAGVGRWDLSDRALVAAAAVVAVLRRPVRECVTTLRATAVNADRLTCVVARRRQDREVGLASMGCLSIPSSRVIASAASQDQ
jgi:hypothetical protein